MAGLYKKRNHFSSFNNRLSERNDQKLHSRVMFGKDFGEKRTITFKKDSVREQTIGNLEKLSNTSLRSEKHAVDDFKKLLEKPENVSKSEWDLVNIVHFFNFLNEILGKMMEESEYQDHEAGISFIEFCKKTEKFGIGEYYYTWRDETDERFQEGKYVSPIAYINLASSWCEKQLSNEETFPTNEKFQKGYRKVLREVLKKLSRIYGFISIEYILAKNPEMYRQLVHKLKHIAVFWMERKYIRKNLILYLKTFVEYHFPGYRGYISMGNIVDSTPETFNDEDLSSKIVIRNKIERE